MKTILVLGCIAALAAAQESQSPPPRQTFERAAYAEEHERDFEKAASLYREAGSVARFLGDEKLATEAMSAVKRVEDRMGKGTDSAPSMAELPIAVQRRLFLLVKALSTPPADPGKDDRWEVIMKIRPFGAAAVLMLERALRADIINDPDMTAPFRGDSTWAARALAQLKIPEALPALMTGVKSADPYVQVAVLGEVNLENHRRVLEEALKDSNPTIVAKAISRMSGMDDPSVASLMKASLTRPDEGGAAAGAWVAGHDPDMAKALLKNQASLSDNQTISDNAFYGLVEAYVESQADASELARTLVEAAEGAKMPFKRQRLLAGLHFLLNRSRLGPAVTGWEEIRDRVETLVLQAFERGEPKDDEQARFSMLRSFGRRRTADALVKALREGRVPPNQTSSVLGFIENQISSLEPSEFKRSVELAVAASTVQPERRQWMFNALINLARKGKGVSPEDLIAGYELMPQGLREDYLTKIVMGVERPPVSLLREVVALGPGQNRNQAFLKMIWAHDPSTLDDAARELSSSDSNTRNAAANLFSSVAPRDVPKALAIIEKSLLSTEVGGSAMETIIGIATSLPPTDVVPLIERLWKDADPNRRQAFVRLLIRYPADAPHPLTVEFLAKNFDAIKEADLRQEAIVRFRNAIYEPAMDVIGAALRDPAPMVRQAALDALDAFRKQREALEEFKRWKSGDAEGRASYAELLKLLESPNITVVEGAVRALGAIKAKGALPAIVKILDRPGVTTSLKEAVDDAIKKIGE